MLTTEQSRDNRKRKLRASNVLNDYSKSCEPECASGEEILTDLLADLMHWASVGTFDDCLRCARDHFQAELTGRE